MSKPRIPLESSRMYHIWTHANGSENLFHEDENYRYFLEKYTYYIQPMAATFAYCLMPNHLHLMVRIREEEDVLKFLREEKGYSNLQGFQNLGGFSNVIAQEFSNLFNAYTKAYNKRYDRKGSLFSPNFRRKRIDSDQYFTRLIAYIHYNPVHHEFVKKPEDWAFNSWHAYRSDKSTKISKKEALAWFGGKEAFRKFHQRLKPEALISVFEK